MAWGGRRTGSGRKPKSNAEKAVTGNPGKRRSATVLAHPSSSAPEPPALPTVSEEDAPNELAVDERFVWLQLAPLAMANGTLTRATSPAFVELCKTVVVVRKMELAPIANGTANHATWKKLLKSQYADFCLTAQGKPMADAVPAAGQPKKNPLDRFMKKSRGA